MEPYTLNPTEPLKEPLKEPLEGAQCIVGPLVPAPIYGPYH